METVEAGGPAWDEARDGPDPFTSQPDAFLERRSSDESLAATRLRMHLHIHGPRDEPRQGLRMGAPEGAAVRHLANLAADQDREYDSMAEGLVREILVLRRTGFQPEHQWSRVFGPLIWGMAPRWRGSLERCWRRLHGSVPLLQALFSAADTMGIAEPRDLCPRTRQPAVLGYIQPGAQERFLASTGFGLQVDAELGRLAGLYDGIAPVELPTRHHSEWGPG